MHANKLIGLNHDIFYGGCDVYELLVPLSVARIDWLYAVRYLLLYNSIWMAACQVSVIMLFS
jgi:hypothetical protein